MPFLNDQCYRRVSFPVKRRAHVLLEPAIATYYNAFVLALPWASIDTNSLGLKKLFDSIQY